ncbi:hypothetical protein [Salibacterium halotolerans]|uniref:Uncharacterized protein n=1 Tax=Salibacterium halotolerans TaxID=1884432 RepID=A0A1I5TC37_9BACI|nr:hypothetical protein [Salibacterium halotolerans]SFP79996.1 hypothetical protein SAMN05518683_11079 [Salibacterium halotolerans]
MKKAVIGLISILTSFCLFTLGLMDLFPLLLGIILLYLSIFFSVFLFNERRRFKGMRMK